MFSDWRRWDLHIHSPESFQHDFKINEGVSSEEFKTKIWERYIEELEKRSEVPCIGITDYFSIDGYRKILQARSEGRLKNYELILPNIEFRTSDTFYYQDGAANRVNFHVIFSDEIHPDIIEREFLSSLSIYDDKGQESGLHRDNLINIGRTLKEHQPEFRDKDD